MPPIPAYDLAFRFERALQPDALRIVATCTTALNEAIADARNAGHNPDNDPAVLLLARHLGRVATGGDPEQLHPEDTQLRLECFKRIAQLRSVDVLIPIVRRGIGFDPHMIQIYKAAARDRLRALAHALGLGYADYQLTSTHAARTIPPAFELRGDRFRLYLEPDRLMPGREVAYMRAETRTGSWTGSPTRADIGVLGNIERFARTLRRELHLPAPAQTTAF